MKFTAVYKILQKTKKILYVGTLNFRKRSSDLLKSLAKIATNYSDLQIMFAGNGEVEQGKALTKELSKYFRKNLYSYY